MYQNTRDNSLTQCILATLTITFLTLVQSAFANTFDAQTTCANAALVDPSTTHRGYENGSPHLVRMDVPSAGILTMDVSPSNPAAAAARLGFSRHRCGEEPGGNEIMTIERSAAHLVLAVRSPGIYTFRLGAQDPRQMLGDYKLTTGFVSATVVDDELTPEPKLAAMLGIDELTVTRTHFHIADFLNKVGEDDTDPGGGGLLSGPLNQGRLLMSVASLHGARRQKVGEDDTDPGGGGKNLVSSTRWVLTLGAAKEGGFSERAGTGVLKQALWPEMQGRQAHMHSAEASELRFRSGRLCHQGGRDDHGDTLRCSTPIAPNQVWTGEIANDWGDDHDTFSFTLSELGTVRIEAVGEIETDVTIYDRFGHRLKRQAGSPVSTLGPGVYFVRVASRHHAEGAYQLEVGLLDW